MKIAIAQAYNGIHKDFKKEFSDKTFRAHGKTFPQDLPCASTRSYWSFISLFQTKALCVNRMRRRSVNRSHHDLTG